MRRYNRGHLGTGLTARRCWCWSQHLAAGLLVTGHASLLVYCSGGMCLRGSPIATQTETQTHLASQPRAAVDAVVPRVVGARRSAASACNHMSHHVTTKSCLCSRCSSPSVAYCACQVDAEVVRARAAVRGAHAAKNRLGEGT